MHSLIRIYTIRTFLSLLPVLFLAGVSSAQEADDPNWNTSSPYYRVMAENTVKLDSTISRAELDRVAATLERVASVEMEQALPHYYLGFVYSTIAFREKDIDQIDVWCDRSDAALEKAEALGGVATEEILVIRALVQYARLQVDFMGRGISATQQAERYLREAYKVNPSNPRVLAILGQHYLNIPAQVGGSREKSCQYASLAVEAFVEERNSRPADIFPIVPHWGELDILEVVEKYCPKGSPATAKTKQP